MPDFVIGLSTAPSSVAFPTTLEINETKLGIDLSYSQTAVPIGGSLFAGILSLLFLYKNLLVLSGRPQKKFFLRECNT